MTGTSGDVDKAFGDLQTAFKALCDAHAAVLRAVIAHVEAIHKILEDNT